MRKYYLLAAILILINTNTLLAQWSAPTTIHTPYGNATIPGIYTPRFYGNYGNKNVYRNSHYKVVLTNDSIITGKGTIKDKDGKTILVMKETHRMIYPSETKRISLYLRKDTVNGTPLNGDNVWLIDKTEKEKKEEKGIVTIYPMSFENDKIYTIDSVGHIIEATRDYLLPIMENDKKAKKKLNHFKIGEAIGIYNSHLKKNKSN